MAINWGSIKLAEDELISYIIKEYGVQLIERAVGNQPYWDCKMANIDNVEKLIELKIDYMSARTGNIAIEFRNSKKNIPSGINITKADVWSHAYVYEDAWHCMFVKVKDLKEYINNNPPHKIIFGGGDKNSDMYIYAIKDLRCNIGEHKFWKNIKK